MFVKKVKQRLEVRLSSPFSRLLPIHTHYASVFRTYTYTC